MRDRRRDRREMRDGRSKRERMGSIFRVEYRRMYREMYREKRIEE